MTFRDLFCDRTFNREFLKLSLPLALQSLMLALVATADAAMLGASDQNSMAAVSLATQVQFIQNMVLFAIAGGVGVGESTRANLPVLPIGRVTTRYQITLEVSDVPGVLATVAGILSEGRVSIATVEQTVITHSNGEPGTARVVIGTHRALEQDLSETVDRLAANGVVGRVVSVLRVEGD